MLKLLEDLALLCLVINSCRDISFRILWCCMCYFNKNFSGCKKSDKNGDDILQNVFEKNEIVKLPECFTDEELSKSDRGSKGFGFYR